jgi:hypothetical protein
VPELVTLIKGMFVAVRTVLSTLILLTAALYVFGIVFREQLGESEPLWFSSVGESMWSLLIYAAMADELNQIAEAVKARSGFMVCLLGLFVLISHITLLNMLVGVLVEVVGQVSHNHKERMDIRSIRDALSNLLLLLDDNNDGTISRREYDHMIEVLEDADDAGMTRAQRMTKKRNIDARTTRESNTLKRLMETETEEQQRMRLICSSRDALDSLGIDENDLREIGESLFLVSAEFPNGKMDVPEFFRFFLSECVEMRNPVTLKDLNVSQKRLRNDLMKAPPPTQLFTI